MFTSARDVTCISHNTCLRRPQRWPILGPASATHLYTSATIPVYVGQNCDLHRPQYLATLIRLPKSTLCSAQHKNKTRRGKKVRNKGKKRSCKKDNSTSCSRKYDGSSDRRKRDKRDARTAL